VYDKLCTSEAAETALCEPLLCTALGCDTAKHAVILPEAGSLQAFLATPAEAIQMFF